MWNLSLRAKLVLGAVLIQSAVFSLVIFNADRMIHGFLRDQVQIRIETIQPLLNAAIAGPLAQHDYANLNDILNEIIQTHAIEHIEVIDADGALAGKAGDTCSDKQPQMVSDYGSGCHDGHAETALVLRIQEKAVGKVVFGISIGFLQVARQSLAKESGLIALLGLALATLLLSIFNWWLTRNLVRLRTAVEKIGQGNYGIETGIEPTRNDEVAVLAQSFDIMSRQIKDSHEVMLKEIEERKRAETLLREKEQHFRTLANGGSTLIWTADINKSCNYFNEPWLSFTGRTLEQEVGNGWTKGVHPDDLEQCLAIYVASFDQRQSFSMEYRLHHADGTYHWLRDDGNPRYDSEGNFIGYIGFCVDITLQKENLAELERYRHHLESIVEERTSALIIAKDAAEAASRAKSTFLANMSHELRTPMNAIMGMTDLVMKAITDPKQLDQLSTVKRASTHLLSVINDILDVSKIEADQLALEETHFKFGALLENLKCITGQRIAEKNLKLVMDLSPHIGRLHLLGDPVRIGQILLNFVGNAVKFTEKGVIAVRIKKLSENENDVLIRCEVEDTGIGISDETQKRLFSPFVQADGSMTRKYGGTGLGLSICKSLIETMGGMVGIESKEGKGSLFWFTLRLQKASNAGSTVEPLSAQSAEVQLKTTHAGKQILLVENELINQEVLRCLLEDAFLGVDLAEDGAQAVEMAQRNIYDLILIEMQLPQMNGVDATKVIRTLPDFAHTPIVAMTANAFDADCQICFAAGMNDHIEKPVEPEKLYEILLKWLSK